MELSLYSECAFVCVNEDTADVIEKTLLKRRDIMAEQKKRVDKILKIIDDGNLSD